MKITQLLHETIINALPDDDTLKNKYKEEAYSILQDAYQSVGGLKGNGFESPDDMVENIPFWKLSIREGKVNAILMYKDKHGRKRVAMATDGSKKAKEDLAKMLIDEYKTKRAYAEISDNSLRFHKKILGDELDTISIPSEDAMEILNDPEKTRIIDDEPYEYLRLINGTWVTKRMVGNPGTVLY